MSPRDLALGSGVVASDPEKPIIHFGSSTEDLIPFLAVATEKEMK